MILLPCPATPAASIARTASAGRLSVPECGCPGWRACWGLWRADWRGGQSTEFPGEEDEVTRPCVDSSAMQALSCPLSPQLPLTTCALAEGHLPLPPALALLSDMAQTLVSQSQAWLAGQGQPLSSKERGGTQVWADSLPTALWLPQSPRWQVD